MGRVGTYCLWTLGWQECSSDSPQCCTKQLTNMPNNCSVFGCKNTKRKTSGLGIKYFQFPKEKNRRQQWIQACSRGDVINADNAVICSMHFTSSDYKDNLKYRLLGTEAPKSYRPLTDTAVPSLNLPQGCQRTLTKDSSGLKLYRDTTTPQLRKRGKKRKLPKPRGVHATVTCTSAVTEKCSEINGCNSPAEGDNFLKKEEEEAETQHTLLGNDKRTASTRVMDPAIEFVSVEVKEEVPDDQVLLPSPSGLDRVSSHPQDPLSQHGMTPEDALCQYKIIHVKEHPEEELWVKDEPVEPMDLVTGSLTTFTSGSGGSSQGSMSQEASEDLVSPTLAENEADGCDSPVPALPKKGRGGKRFPIWNYEASEKLIQLVRENILRVDNKKKKKPIIWHEITEALQSLAPGLTQQQVQMKWRICKSRFMQYRLDRREGRRRRHKPMHYELMSSFIPDVRPVFVLEGASSSPLIVSDTRLTQYDFIDLPESDQLEPAQDTEPSQVQGLTHDTDIDQPPEQPQTTDTDQPPSTAMVTQQAAQHHPPPPPTAETIKSKPSTATKEMLEILKQMRNTLDELFVSSAEYHENQLKYLESVNERDAEKHRIDMKIKEEQLQIVRLQRAQLEKESGNS